MKHMLLVTVFLVLCSGLSAEPSRPDAAHLTDIHEIGRFVGTYPCENGLLDSPAFRTDLKRTLGADYGEYLKHIAASGCGKLEMRDDYAIADVSQLHVGGYSSYIFVHPIDGTMFVFWLNSTVREEHWAFYGPKPIPDVVLRTVASELNVAWGHVAHFQIVGQDLEILLRKH